MDSDLTASSEGRRNASDDDATHATAIVRIRDDEWFVDVSGDPPEWVPSQVDGILLAADVLRARGGGQVLIRERGGGPYKRLVIEGSRS